MAGIGENDFINTRHDLVNEDIESIKEQLSEIKMILREIIGVINKPKLSIANPEPANYKISKWMNG